MGLGDSLKKQALEWSQKAVEVLLADEQRAGQIAKLIGQVQRGRKVLTEGQDELMRSLQFSPSADYKAVGKQLSGLKRRLREMDERLTQTKPHAKRQQKR
jgi:hypothetical protein